MPPSTLVGVNADAAYATTGPGVNAAPGPAAARGPNQFTIGGNVSGLFPGATAPLVLTVSNPQRHPIRVLFISTMVDGLTPNCGDSNLTVSKFWGSLKLPPKHSGHVTVFAHMAHAAPDTCQGAQFQLVYSGQGTAP